MTENRDKILIVDDERLNINTLVSFLEADYDTIVAKNGKQAIKRASAAMPPDLILLDIMMPDVDGYQVCRQLKMDPKTQHIPIIFISARTEDTDEARGLELGAVDYITKPISPPIVLARIKTQLKLKHAYEELENKKLALEEAAVLRDNVERITRHDLKTPLGAVLGASAVLMEELKLDKEHLKMLKMIEEAGYKMLNLINGSLDLYKMETGTYQYKPGSLNIVQVLKKIVDETTNIIKLKGLVITMVLRGKLVTEGDTFKAEGEQLLCYSMFANLFKNALEASPKKGTVTVFMDELETAVISIHNQGAIPHEIRDKFLEKYTTAGKLGGTGLGTYSAKLMAETQGGSIDYETEETDGTTVRVRLQIPRYGG